jgi:hypothetical protein
MNIRTNHFNKEVLKRCKKIDPVLYKKLRIQDINKVLQYMMKNLNLCITKKQDIYVTNYFSCHMNKKARKRKIMKNLPEI